MAGWANDRPMKMDKPEAIAAEQQQATASQVAAATVAPAPVAAPRPTDQQYLDHLKKVNDVFYDQIRIADQKAAYIFTFMVAFLVTSAEGRGAYKLERYLSGEPITIILSGVLALAVLVSIVSAILVVLPRHREVSASLYWGGWASHRNEFLAARETGDTAYLAGQYLTNVDNLAAINRQKYRFVAWAFQGLLVAVIAYCLLLAYGTGATLLPK
jgi:hypothetical protein